MITGIVSEFNPFHKGHEYLLRTLRSRGAEVIICVMSGNFVQRGEPALVDKYSRAAMAVDCGADVVVELPYPYSAASAEYFASAGVRVLDAMGVNTLGFGSECGDISVLYDTAEVVAGDAFIECYRQRCRRGEGAAAAYYSSYRELTDKDMPTGSNDILGIEYIKAAKHTGIDINFECVGRVGSEYRSEGIDSSFPSATALRQLLFTSGASSLEPYMPKPAYEGLLKALDKGLAPASLKYAQLAILSFLRLSTQENFKDIAEGSQGLGNRLKKAALVSANLDEVLRVASAKNFTDTRLRRAVLFGMTGVNKADIRRCPKYMLLLAASRHGSEYLKKMRGKTKIPLITKPADADMLTGDSERQKKLSDISDAFWTLMLEAPLPAYELIKKGPYIV